MNYIKVDRLDHHYKISELPHLCPYCHKSITPNPLHGHFVNKPNSIILEVFMVCPDINCQRGFVAYYFNNNTHNDEYGFAGLVSKGKLKDTSFSDTINKISPLFSEIYNQAFKAEQEELKEICGVGFRKALEFLIKDYSVENNQADKEIIEKMLLGKVIETYVKDDRIKSVAKRAAWLGNDETHYVRKWEGKNLEDLKRLISLTIHWIEMETLTRSFVDDMPEK